MTVLEIKRDEETGKFTVMNGDTVLPTPDKIEVDDIQADIDKINRDYDAGLLDNDAYNEQIEPAFDALQNAYENNSHAIEGKTFYGNALKINLGNDHDLMITQDALDELHENGAVLDLDGVNRLIIPKGVIDGFDPDSFRAENEVVGIDDGEILITNTETYDIREADEWFNGEVFQFGDENNTKFVINNVSSDDIGVQTLVIGDTEINLAERLSRYNELKDVTIKVSEEEAKANSSYRTYQDGTFGIRDMEAYQEGKAILIGIHEEIRDAIINTQQASPSLDNNQVAPELTIPELR